MFAPAEDRDGLARFDQSERNGSSSCLSARSGDGAGRPREPEDPSPALSPALSPRASPVFSGVSPDFSPAVSPRSRRAALEAPDGDGPSGPSRSLEEDHRRDEARWTGPSQTGAWVGPRLVEPVEHLEAWPQALRRKIVDRTSERPGPLSRGGAACRTRGCIEPLVGRGEAAMQHTPAPRPAAAHRTSSGRDAQRVLVSHRTCWKRPSMIRARSDPCPRGRARPPADDGATSMSPGPLDPVGGDALRRWRCSRVDRGVHSPSRRATARGRRRGRIASSDSRT